MARPIRRRPALLLVAVIVAALCALAAVQPHTTAAAATAAAAITTTTTASGTSSAADATNGGSSHSPHRSDNNNKLQLQQEVQQASPSHQLQQQIQAPTSTREPTGRGSMPSLRASSDTPASTSSPEPLPPPPPPPPPPPLPPIVLPPQIAFLNPTAVWLREPSQLDPTGQALVLMRRFDGTNATTWYKGAPAGWRAGSIRNFVGETCLVAALAYTRQRWPPSLPLPSSSSTAAPPTAAASPLEIDPSSIHYAHDCLAERRASARWSDHSRIEDARAFRRADGSLWLLYSSPMGGEERHTVFAAPVEMRGARTATRARVALERRVAPCAALLSRLELPRFQKNWAPFAYGGQDFVVYSVLPLRIFRVEYESAVVGEHREAGVAECEEVSASTPVELKERLEDCNAISRLPSHAQQQAAWRRCTGSARPLARVWAGGAAEERQLARAFTLTLGGGTPGVLLAAHADGRHRPDRLPGPATAALGGGGDDILLFAGHSKLHAGSAALIDQMQPAPADAVDTDDAHPDVGPESGWHASYEKLYHAFWYALKPRGASSVAPSSSSRFTFELVSLSRFFTPPNSRWDHPKIVYPTGLLLHPATLTASNSSDAVATAAAADGCASPFGCAGSTRLHMTYGELDVLGHAWSPTLREILRTLIPSDRLATRALPLWLRDGEAARRRHASTTQPNDLSAPFYASHLPVGAPRSGETKGAAARAAGGEHAVSRCRGSGFEMLWNTALHPFQALQCACGMSALPH